MTTSDIISNKTIKTVFEVRYFIIINQNLPAVRDATLTVTGSWTTRSSRL